MYFLKYKTFHFSLFEKNKRHLLNNLLSQPNIQFIFNKKIKLFHFIYIMQQSALFISFVMLGFFIFSSCLSMFHFYNIEFGLFKTWSDFCDLHYVSFFICLLSSFGLLSLFNLFFQLKISSHVKALQNINFPVENYLFYFQEELQRISATPIHQIIMSNNNLYGLLVFLVLAKHIEKEEIKLIPDYFLKHW